MKKKSKIQNLVVFGPSYNYKRFDKIVGETKTKKMSKKLEKMFEINGGRKMYTQLSPALKKLLVAFAELMAEISLNEALVNEQREKEKKASSWKRPSFKMPDNGVGVLRKYRQPK